jgi:hypothetical protein
MNLKAILLTLFVTAAALLGQSGSPDPAFAGVPFEEWLAKGETAQIPWKVQVSAGDLSVHQRLHALLRVEVDGKELVKRRGRGELLLLAEFTDHDGRTYRTHNSLKLDDVTSETAQSYMECLVHALVAPGDYRIGLVLLDSVSGDHSAARRTLRVEPLKNDPLPQSWTGLPPVEYPLTTGEASARWFQPVLSGRLNLPLNTRRPVRVELLVNVTPSEGTPRRATAFNLNMDFLIPSAKVISQVNAGAGAVKVALLDLSRQRVTFEQEISQGWDWPRLKASFQESDPNKIDVRSLQNREHNAEFFVREISRRMEAAGDGAPCAFIILSAPMEFEPDTARPSPPRGNRNCRLFYVRYSWAAEAWRRQMRDSRISRRAPVMDEPPPTAPYDSLEPLLRTLEPRLFEVTGARDFRKALAAILGEISRW